MHIGIKEIRDLVIHTYEKAWAEASNSALKGFITKLENDIAKNRTVPREQEKEYAFLDKYLFELITELKKEIIA